METNRWTKVINNQTGLSNPHLPFPLSKTLAEFVIQNQPPFPKSLHISSNIYVTTDEASSSTGIIQCRIVNVWLCEWIFTDKVSELKKEKHLVEKWFYFRYAVVDRHVNVAGHNLLSSIYKTTEGLIPF